tara:strand:- start:12172 stop:13980 length:1809 start_codon:yes stop_codon:yes gene_type:complete
MPSQDPLYISQIPPAAGLWDSTAKAAVMESLRRAQFEAFQRWRSLWRGLHAFYDGEHAAIMLDRLKVTHPERVKDWAKQESGFRFVPIVRAWIERMSVIFHSPPTVYLHRGDHIPLEADHPAVVQWKKDAKQIQLDQTLNQIEAWTNLMGQAFVQPAWVKGSEMRWIVHTPYEITIDQDPDLPDEIEGAYISALIRQPADTLGITQPDLYSVWRQDGGQWYNWITDERGDLKVNRLFPDNVSRYKRPGSGHPFVVFRREKPAPGLAYCPPDEALYQFQISTNLKAMDMDWLLRYQAHAQPVIKGHMIDDSPTMGPSRVLTFPDRDGDFSFVSPTPNLAEYRESWNFDIRLAAVAAGMPPDTFEPVSTTRNLASKQLENYTLKLKREKAIPAYLSALSKLWESHRMVANHWAEQTGMRYRYDDDLELGFKLAPIPEVYDRFQDVQASAAEIGHGLASVVSTIARREGCTREEAKRRADERRADGVELRRAAVDESGVSEQVVEVSTDAVLNGAQVVAAKGIVESVALGTLPVDAGHGMLRILFNLTPEQAADIMGSAGGSFAPTTATDGPKTNPAPQPPDPPPTTKGAAGYGVPRPASVRKDS